MRRVPKIWPTMLILFDHGSPRGVARALRAHSAIKAKGRGWDKRYFIECGGGSLGGSVVHDGPGNSLPAELDRA